MASAIGMLFLIVAGSALFAKSISPETSGQTSKKTAEASDDYSGSFAQ